MTDNVAKVGFLLIVLLLIYANASGRLPNALGVLRSGNPTLTQTSMPGSILPPVSGTTPPLGKTPVPPSWNQYIPYDPFGSGNTISPSTLEGLLLANYGLG